jgi:hypothetical protein
MDLFMMRKKGKTTDGIKSIPTKKKLEAIKRKERLSSEKKEFTDPSGSLIAIVPKAIEKPQIMNMLRKPKISCPIEAHRTKSDLVKFNSFEFFSDFSSIYNIKQFMMKKDLVKNSLKPEFNRF